MTKGAEAGGEDQANRPAFTLSPALAASLALLVAALAAVGVTGDAVPRAVRNNPWWIAAAITAVLMSAGLLVLPGSRSQRYTGLLVMLLVLAVIGAVWLGAAGVADREQPLVTLQSAADNKGRITLTIDVSAAGLRTTDEILIQVVGLKRFAATNETIVELCERNHTWTSASPQDYQAIAPQDGRLLLWDRIGPDRGGTVKNTLKVEVASSEYEGVCAWAPLPEKAGESAVPRNSAAYLKLIPDPKATSTPSGTPTSPTPSS